MEHTRSSLSNSRKFYLIVPLFALREVCALLRASIVLRQSVFYVPCAPLFTRGQAESVVCTIN